MSAKFFRQRQEAFESGIREIVQWYLDNQQWLQNMQSGKYCGRELLDNRLVRFYLLTNKIVNK